MNMSDNDKKSLTIKCLLLFRDNLTSGIKRVNYVCCMDCFVVQKHIYN